MRFDETTTRSVYRDCRWCRGRGCLYCKSEADKAFKIAFPNGAEPMATFTLAELDKARDAIGAEAVTKAFSPGGRGLAEVIQNIEKIKRGES